MMAVFRVTRDVDNIPVARCCQKLGAIYLILYIYIFNMGGTLCAIFFSGLYVFGFYSPNNGVQCVVLALKWAQGPNARGRQYQGGSPNSGGDPLKWTFHVYWRQNWRKYTIFFKIGLLASILRFPMPTDQFWRKLHTFFNFDISVHNIYTWGGPHQYLETSIFFDLVLPTPNNWKSCSHMASGITT